MTSHRRATTVACGLAALCLMAGLPSASGASTSVAPVGSSPVSTTAPSTGVPAHSPAASSSTVNSAARVEPAATGITGTVSPFRLYDSRRTRVLAAGEVRRLCVSGTTVPADAAAVVVNVTAVSPTTSGYLTVWNPDHGQPAVSTLNFGAGTVTANLAVVELATDRCLVVRNSSSGTTHVLLDVQSFVMPGPAIAPGSTQTTRPSRLLDTRTRVRVPGRGSITVQVAGRGGIPSTGAGAAWLNLTASNTTAGGWVTIHPADAARPTTSNLNFGARDTRAGLTLATLGANGAVTAYNGSADPIHLIVDAFGWTRSGDATRTLAGVVPVSPTRIWDTRTAGPLSGGETLTLNRADRRPGAAAAVLAVTAVGASRPGYLVVSGTFIATNPTSALNYVPGRATTNLVIARQDDEITVTNGPGSPVHVVVDLVGWVNGERGTSGRVVDSVGRGVPSAIVGTEYRGGGPAATSRDDGSFELNMRIGNDQLTLCATAWRGSQPAVDYADGCHPSWNATPVTLGLGERLSDAKVVLESAGSLQGTATDDEGQPLSSGIVRLLRKSDSRTYLGGFSVVDGRWSADRIAVGDYYVQLTHPVSATKAPFGLAAEWYPDVPVGGTSAPTVLAGLGARTVPVTVRSTTTLDLVAEANAVVKGTLRKANGDPLGVAAHVILHHADGTRFGTAVPDRTSGEWSARLHPGSVVACGVHSFDSPRTCWQGDVPLEQATPIVVTAGQSRDGVAITLP
ncbi:hypothetical protein Q9R29_17080 [Rothia sp. ARF10]|nr:hypothetical protein [Rothia sp. ARF10]